MKNFFRIGIVPQQAAWVAAYVIDYGPDGNTITYVPANDPNGVFFGRSDIQFGDTWKFDPHAVLTLTEYAGGRYQASGPSGTYPLVRFGLRRALDGSVSYSTTTVTLP